MVKETTTTNEEVNTMNHNCPMCGELAHINTMISDPIQADIAAAANCKVCEGLAHVLKQLSPADCDYVKAQGTGFSALHDICDANMLLPESDDLDFLNAIIGAFDAHAYGVSKCTK